MFSSLSNMLPGGDKESAFERLKRRFQDEEHEERIEERRKRRPLHERVEPPAEPASAAHSPDTATGSVDVVACRGVDAGAVEPFYSSAGSSASVQSFASATSSTRRIIPLYNLSAHNVLQNTVQDAGTDATVSRFRKRGIDVIGLGVLEPLEVHGPLDAMDTMDIGHASDVGHASDIGHEPPPLPKEKESTGKRLFGKLFRKKESLAPPPSPMLLSPARDEFARPASVYSVSTPTTPQPGLFLQPPVLGTQAALCPDAYPPAGRPTAYVWVLRRWSKGSNILAGLVGAGGLEMARLGIQVRFEWVRGKKRRRDQLVQKARPASVVSVTGIEGLSLGVPTDGISMRSTSPSRQSHSPDQDDDADESDPEDSETPWECTLRVTGDSELKLRLAHLVPAPHHPKVIAQFKMPFPLPDVAIQRLELVPRAAADPFGMDPSDGPDMVMTAEEIKDVVCTTGLWLVVREGFGGLAGKKRKGDGFKIRS
ncbi:hypothetical protein CTheo_8163 [Ceratobasidium theobromae]|uniref:Uncharacterized protein n=1 Tax=Ceratobasidium theobromae TaxID=1582974 RepID=A0A5N5Q9J0_9AGAM|nr:hypothetical protein CTheo_8163 [Ceratobasidium theobromae]